MSNVYTRVIPEKIISGRRLGRAIEHDARSRAFGVVMQPRPIVSVVWERHCDAYDQGDLGSCTGNAMAGALMTGPLFQDGRLLVEDDAVKLYELATTLDNIPGSYPPEDTGSSGLAVARAARNLGMIDRFHHAFGLAATLQALSAGPIILGLNWWGSFDEPAGDRAELVLRMGDDEVRGGHEMVVDLIDVEAGYVGGHNSWGPGWGDHGRYVMTFGTLDVLLKQYGDVIAPLARAA